MPHVDELGSDDEPLDLEAWKERLLLVWRAPFRHKLLSLSIVLIVLAAGFLASRKLPPVYRADAAILVQRNVMLPNFADPNRAPQVAEFDPSAGVPELVKGHENLLSMVEQTHLLKKFPVLRGEDGKTLPDAERTEILAKVVAERLSIASDGNLVTFAASWTDPQTAFDLVSAALHNFLEARNAAEVSIIVDAIGLLEEHAQAERDNIDVAMTEFIRLREGWKLEPAAPGQAPAIVYRRPPGDSAAPDPDLTRRIDEKKMQIREAEDERRRQLGDLKAQMAGLLGTYTPSYPPVLALQRKIDSLSEDPPPLVTLKNEERALLAELSAKAAAKTALRSYAAAPTATAGRGAATAPSKQDLEISDPESAMALSRLQNRIHKYEEYMDEISAAKLQLDLARSAFRYRYTVQRPPVVPERPRHSVRQILMVASSVLAVILTFAVSALLDIASGTFLHPWQVRRKLALPLLGEVTEHRAAGAPGS